MDRFFPVDKAVQTACMVKRLVLCRAGDFLVRLRKPPVRSPAFRRRYGNRAILPQLSPKALMEPFDLRFFSLDEIGTSISPQLRSPRIPPRPPIHPIQSACHLRREKPAAFAPETFHHPAACLNPGPKPTHRFPVEKRGNLSQSCRSLHRNPWQSLLPPRISRPRRNRERLFTASPQPRIPPRPNPLAIFG